MSEGYMKYYINGKAVDERTFKREYVDTRFRVESENSLTLLMVRLLIAATMPGSQEDFIDNLANVVFSLDFNTVSFRAIDGLKFQVEYVKPEETNLEIEEPRKEGE